MWIEVVSVEVTFCLRKTFFHIRRWGTEPSIESTYTVVHSLYMILCPCNQESCYTTLVCITTTNNILPWRKELIYTPAGHGNTAQLPRNALEMLWSTRTFVAAGYIYAQGQHGLCMIIQSRLWAWPIRVPVCACVELWPSNAVGNVIICAYLISELFRQEVLLWELAVT